MNTTKSHQSPMRILIARCFSAVEDIVYIILGLLLAGVAFTLLWTGTVEILAKR
ncbi:MAG: hypothetical protein ACJ8FY_11140 [Gemmataceae bacterium]